MKKQHTHERSVIATDEADWQMRRPFSRAFVASLRPSQRNMVRTLLFNAALHGMEKWDETRSERDEAAFFGRR